MVKIIGLLLIFSSFIAMLTGAYIDSNFASSPQISGNVAINLLDQPKVSMSIYDYLAGFIFSYSIMSFIIGIVFFFRV